MMRKYIRDPKQRWIFLFNGSFEVRTYSDEKEDHKIQIRIATENGEWMLNKILTAKTKELAEKAADTILNDFELFLRNNKANIYNFDFKSDKVTAIKGE